VAHELHVLGPVLVHISDGLGSAARTRLLMALGGTFDDMRRTAVEWAHVTGMLEDVALAKALEEMSENASS
jgi:hypothetical protein